MFGTTKPKFVDPTFAGGPYVPGTLAKCVERFPPDAAMVRRALSAGGDPNSAAELSGETNRLPPLVSASISDGYGEVVRALLEAGADTDARNAAGGAQSGEGSGVGDRTALMYAAIYGRCDVVQILLDGDANPLATTNDGYTALGYAKRNVIKDFTCGCDGITKMCSCAGTVVARLAAAEAAAGGGGL